jgi:group II intron reverse transcriptase/maturase
MQRKDKPTMETELERIAAKARSEPKLRFTSLAHHITRERVWTNLCQIPKRSAPGVDGQTVTEAKETFGEWVEPVLRSVHRQGYRAPDIRRVYIPKPGKREKRPLGVPCVNDRALQRSTAQVLSAIHEADFLPCSFGGRPERGAHHALATLNEVIAGGKVSWVLEADLKNFFGSLSHEWVLRFVEHRVGDRRIVRLIHKWLKAGVLEDGIVNVSDKGTGQGAVISPLLANIYLHYGLDQWAEGWRRHEATGDMIIVRYADDFIVGFEYESDARRFLDAMRERLGKFALSLHPEKTRLIEFGRLAAESRERRGLGKPETFNFLGFTFICSKSRRGKFQIKRKSRHDRMRVKLQAIKQELRRRIHQPIPVQGKWLRQVVTGYFNYHAVPTNGPALAAFRFFVTELWQRTLRRRSQMDGMTWERITRLANDWLPKPHVLHPWPQARFAVTHPRWEPYAGIPLVRICAGGAQQ